MAFKSYRWQLPNDTFQAPPAGSGGQLGHQYKQQLRSQFGDIVRHSIKLFGAEFVKATVMKAIQDAAEDRD